MYISQLRLWNFRKYATKDGEVILDSNPGLVVNFKPGVNLMIGENDSGKTAIIDAIKYLLLTQSREYIGLDEYDFHQPNCGIRSKKLKIEAVFKGFENSEAANFLEWIGFDNNGNYELSTWLTAECKDNHIIVNFRSGADSEGSLMDGNARDLLRVTYLKPLRDAESELTPGYKSRLAQILKNYPAFNPDNPEYENYLATEPDENSKRKHQLEKFISDANDSIERFFNPDDFSNPESQNSVKISSDLLEYLKDFFPKHEFDKNSNINHKHTKIQISGSNLHDILKRLSLTLEDNKSGLGSLNLLYIAAELLLLRYSRKDGLKLLLIEEMEAHLHPQAQLRLIEHFNKAAKKQQVILTTHSITLGSKIPLENLFICKNDKVFPMGHSDTQLYQGDYKFLERFLDVTKANLFFARGVIIVEGDAENILIPAIAEIIGKPLHEYGVSIVNVGGTAYKRYSKIFLRKNKDDKENSEWLNIPVSIITDKDKKTESEVDGLKQKLNKQNNRVFIPLHRTLEYDILKSDLKDELKTTRAKFVTNGFKVRTWEYKPKQYATCFLDKKNSYVINYDGRIHKCVARDYKNALGEINTNGEIILNTNYSKRYSKNVFNIKKCVKCKELPLCFGPCGQNISENEEIDDFCKLNDIEISINDYIIRRADEILSKIK